MYVREVTTGKVLAHVPNARTSTQSFAWPDADPTLTFTFDWTSRRLVWHEDERPNLLSGIDLDTGHTFAFDVGGSIGSHGFTANGLFVTTVRRADSSGTIVGFDLASQKRVYALNGLNGGVELSADGTRIATMETVGGKDWVVMLDARNGARLLAFSVAPCSPARLFDLHASGERVAVGGGNRACLFDARTGRRVFAVKRELPLGPDIQWMVRLPLAKDELFGTVDRTNPLARLNGVPEGEEGAHEWSLSNVRFACDGNGGMTYRPTGKKLFEYHGTDDCRPNESRPGTFSIWDSPTPEVSPDGTLAWDTWGTVWDFSSGGVALRAGGEGVERQAQSGEVQITVGSSGRVYRVDGRTGRLEVTSPGAGQAPLDVPLEPVPYGRAMKVELTSDPRVVLVTTELGDQWVAGEQSMGKRETACTVPDPAPDHRGRVEVAREACAYEAISEVPKL